MNKITTVGVDLAKSVFSVHRVDADGRTVLRKTVRRDNLMELIVTLPPCLIGAAWLGLVPRQHSTGGRNRPGRITKRGDAYLRTLLMLGAPAVLQNAGQKSDRLSRRAMALRERRGYHRAVIEAD